MRLSDLVFEWTTHIQDGLTLLAQRGGVPLETDRRAAADILGRAATVAKWLVGQSVPGFSCEWLRTPVGVSDARWVLAVSDGYRRFGGQLMIDPAVSHVKGAGS